jgi:hypothetical protein
VTSNYNRVVTILPTCKTLWAAKAFSALSSLSSLFLRILSFSCIERLGWLSIILQVVEYSSGSPESNCPKSIASVNTSLKELSAVTTCTAVFLRDTYISSIDISLESLNKAIFAISSQFACGWVLLYFAFS